MSRHLRKIGVLFYISCSFVSAEQTLSLEQVLARVEESHPLFQRQALEVEVAEAKADGLLGARDWSMRLGPSFRHDEPIQETTFSSKKIDALGVEAGMEKSVWSTGGRLSVNASHSATDQESAEVTFPGAEAGGFKVSPEEFYKNGVLLEYRQPLLKNFRGTLDRLQYELQEMEVDIADLQAREQEEGLLLEAARIYVNWALDEKLVKVANERLALASEQLDKSKRDWEANLVEKVDFLRAENDVQNARVLILQSQSSAEARKIELATMLQDNSALKKVPALDIDELPSIPDVEGAEKMLKEKSRLLSEIRFRLDQLAHQKQGVSDQDRAALDIVVGGGVKSGDAEYGDSFDLDRQEYAVGLLFSKPWGNRSAKAELRGLDLQRAQLEYRLLEVELQLRAGLRSIVVQMEQLKKVIQVNEEQEQTAQARTEEEQRLYDQGRNELNFVIQSRDQERNVRSITARNAAAYQLLHLEYRALLDQLHTDR